MASALTDVLKASPIGEEEVSATEISAVMPIMRAFMGSLITNQLGTSVGQLALAVTGSNDVAIPLFNQSQARLIPQNISAWSDGLDIPLD